MRGRSKTSSIGAKDEDTQFAGKKHKKRDDPHGPRR